MRRNPIWLLAACLLASSRAWAQPESAPPPPPPAQTVPSQHTRPGPAGVGVPAPLRHALEQNVRVALPCFVVVASDHSASERCGDATTQWGPGAPSGTRPGATALV